MNYDNPFPGMNPYLEQPHLWPEVHNEMIALLWSSLGLQIPFGYRLAIEQRLELWEAPFVDDRPRFVVPDLSVTERGELQREVALKERTIPEDGLVVMTPGTNAGHVPGSAGGVRSSCYGGGNPVADQQDAGQRARRLCTQARGYFGVGR